MSRFEGKVAFITGAARGMGRAAAIRLAQDGADIIGLDICRTTDEVAYPLATPEDLARTVKEVEAHDRRILAREADVRDLDAVRRVLDEGVAELGGVDIVFANAGIGSMAGEVANSQTAWHAAIDTMLTGVLHTIQAAVPHLMRQGRGGSIVITSSTAGLIGMTFTPEMASPGFLGYGAAKHGVVGLMRNYARALAPHNIRVNCIHPGATDTPLIGNSAFEEFVTANPTIVEGLACPMPVEKIDPADIAAAVAWLSSDEARWITGAMLPVDGGGSL